MQLVLKSPERYPKKPHGSRLRLPLFLAQITWLAVISLTVGLWAVSGALLWLGYEPCLNRIGSFLQADNQLLNKIKMVFFTEQKYHTLLVLIPAVGCCWAGLAVSLSRVRLLRFWLSCWKELLSLARFLRRLSPQTALERWALAVLLLTFGALLGAGLVLFPMTYDEAWFYVTHVKRSPLYALFYYPYPGNHILYTFIASCLQAVVADFRGCMRLPNLLLSLTTIYFAWGFAKNKLGIWKGTYWTAILGLGFSAALYSFLGRGYYLFAIATGLYVIALLRWYSHERSRLWPAVMCLCGFLAGATQPTYLYWLGVTNGWFFLTSFKKKTVNQYFFSIHGWLLLLLATWYLPAISFLDFNHISQNELLKTYSYAALQHFFWEYWNYVWETASVYRLGGYLAILMLLFYVREYIMSKKAPTLLMALLIGLPFGVVWGQRMAPPDKTWMPLVFVWGSFWGKILSSITFKGRVIQSLVIFTAVLLIVHQIVGFIPAIWERFETDFSAQNVHRTLLAAGVNNILIPAKWKSELETYEVILRGYEHNYGKVHLIQTIEKMPDAILYLNTKELSEKITVFQQVFVRKYQDKQVAVFVRE